ncbi:MAG TPA: rhomboid family intramembrane serine protease, partial [Afifellaceae bacterium]|nr:rhomboid family intramembrane serine protease [Afifellaceae bacterium]
MFLPLYDINPMRHLTRPYVNYGLIAATVFVFFLTGGIDLPAVEQSAVSLGLIPSVVNDIHDLPPDAVLVPTAATYVTYA